MLQHMETDGGEVDKVVEEFWIVVVIDSDDRLGCSSRHERVVLGKQVGVTDASGLPTRRGIAGEQLPPIDCMGPDTDSHLQTTRRERQFTHPSTAPVAGWRGSSPLFGGRG